MILACVVFWPWMYPDMTGNDDLPANAKDRWTTLFIFMNGFGAILYCVNVYRRRF
ncbi:MAG: hypothetical protein M1434_09600 [Chloroflexi bacterium]|nr:hypothetical protein [Chloroflexota bacterium]